ncbi:MAG: MBL fold metallo-hydrolase [Draconibacterium sp.]|nr:MBL fold metallo-hydrolase [Draconibacterium sp.]
MKIIPISAGNFHCDGGALFSVIPKKLWGKVYPADENNFTKLALRCLLIDYGEQKILIEAGIGNHFPEKHLQNNGVENENCLEESLKKNGYTTDDITDIIFTHLHWDHCTGAVKNRNGKLLPVFTNAKYWCSKKQWEHSKISNPREKAAYHKGVLDFIFKSGKLNLVENEGELFANIEVRFFDGHTPGQMIPFIRYEDKTVVYMADLIPTSTNIPLLWLAAYDLYPVKAMEEKELFLNETAKNGYILFFEHDFYTECVTVSKTEKGFVLKDKFTWLERG